MKKEEMDNIIKNIVPKLSKFGFDFKIDTATSKTKPLRGDVWLKNGKEYLGLIEAKSIHCIIGDRDWKDAMRQGKAKSLLQGLPFYIVTNTNDYTRYYNSSTDEEITIDDEVITGLVNKKTTIVLKTKINQDVSDIRTKSKVRTHSENEFSKSLKKLRNYYRSCGLDKDKLISPTISFIIIKYIGELEIESRTLDSTIEIWSDFIKSKNYKNSFSNFINNVWIDKDLSSKKYKDFKSLIDFPEELTTSIYEQIYLELDMYNFHGGIMFDIFGSVYEAYATSNAKKAFGEYYTRRHITSLAAKTLLCNVNNIHPSLRIADPACGTGGFLTEAFKFLYTKHNDEASLKNLSGKVFYGYDSNLESVNRTKLNMFLVGDGHNNIYHIKDSLFFNNSFGWESDSFDYILANPPMGVYSGDADINQFNYSNKKKMETLFLEKIITSLKPGGRACIVINDGPLENPTSLELRKKLLNDVTIIAIVSLSKFAFAPYTKEKTYLMYFEKKIKKENEHGIFVGELQKTPIYHYILDYDGYANSDKRYRTKYHDDIPELELNIRKLLLNVESPIERKCNEREVEEGLTGWKSKFVSIDEMKSKNYCLTSEKYLRNTREISYDDAVSKMKKALRNIKGLKYEI